MTLTLMINTENLDSCWAEHSLYNLTLPGKQQRCLVGYLPGKLTPSLLHMLRAMAKAWDSWGSGPELSWDLWNLRELWLLVTTKYSAVTLLDYVWCWITCFEVKGSCCRCWLWIFTSQCSTALKEERLSVLLVTSWMPLNINNRYLDLDKKGHWFILVRPFTLSLL